MSLLNLFLFGHPRIERDGRLIEITLRKGQALLAYLAVEGKSHNRYSLAAMFWPESNQDSALASLRRTIYEVNLALEATVIQTNGETICLSEKIDLWLDSAAFCQYASCLNNYPPNATLPPDCLDALAEAARLQHDAFLAGFSLNDCPEFEKWQFLNGEALRLTLLRVLQALISSHMTRHSFTTAIKYGRRWLSIEPWHEPTHRTLMTLYAETGQRVLALLQFEQCRRLLYHELDLEPEPATIALYEAIKTGRLTPNGRA
ncbi:MAG: BTAD domain-containing putative transcriptional regulator [Candidatus Promineifilaceae bacterium]